MLGATFISQFCGLFFHLINNFCDFLNILDIYMQCICMFDARLGDKE